MESFRISGNADSGTNDSSNDEVILAATEFKFSCNLCGKGGHKAKDCPQRNNVKCEHCGRLGHTKATCWKLEANKSKRPEWWNDMAAATADEGKLAPPLNKLECECKPDIAMTVHQCARFSANPMRSHEQAVMCIGRYLLSTQDRGMTYTPDFTKGIKVYVVVDFAGGWDPGDAMNADNVYLRTGYVIRYAGCPIYWQRKLQTEIALSTAESRVHCIISGSEGDLTYE